ncbi:glycosyltransferase family 4 protein [Fusibacter bizertensis]
MKYSLVKIQKIDKPRISVMSLADKVKGQGVGSAYSEQLNLIEERLDGIYDIKKNTLKSGEITHYHSINFRFFVHSYLNRKRTVRVGSVHFIPETIEGSITLPPWMKRIFYWYILEFYKNMDQLVTVNPIFIDKLVDLGFSRDNISYIPNFVSREQFYKITQEEKNRVRAKYGLTENDFVLLGVGQVQTRKGILDFVEVAKSCPDFQFIWAGGFSFGRITDGYDALSEVVQNPPKNVKFLGIIDRSQMNEIYNMADVMFLPSYSELFPMTVLEAMNVGIPMLLRDLELYENILFDYYLRANDNDTFSNLIKKLSSDTSYYKNWAMQSQKGSDFYCRDSVGKMWEEYYAQMLELESSDHYAKKSKAYY